MNSRFSPQSLIASGAILCLSVLALSLTLALGLPQLGANFSADDDTLIIRQLEPETPNPALPTGTIKTFLLAGERLPASTDWLIEEPDVLPSYSRYNKLMGDMSSLYQALQNGQLYLPTENGTAFQLTSTTRQWHELPALFWWQLLFGMGGAMTGILVWSSRQSSRATIFYALSGLGYLLFAPAAAVYSTRELIIDGELFRLLSIVNHFGALLFTASLSCLLAVYPRPLGSKWIISGIMAGSLTLWIVDTLQWASPLVFHMGVLSVFSISFVFAAIQWRLAGRDPLDRAALRWFLLSIYLATGLFAAVIIIPAALNIPQPASQGVMFGAFLIMYWGLALGIVRYRLFAINQWWNAIMAWFFGGLLLVVVDLFLILGLALPAEWALSLAIAVSGWLYFPIRQLLWSRWQQKNHPYVQDWLPDILPTLLQRDVNLVSQWPHLLQRVYKAASVEPREGARLAPEIADHGMTLLVPALAAESQYHYCLSGAAGGLRLFGRGDKRIFGHLEHIVRLSLEITSAERKGALQERQRIRRDLHDDIGAHLLTLLHSCEPALQVRVRQALAATRELVQDLQESGPMPLQQALQQWRDEARFRCDTAGTKLAWSARIDANPPLDSFRLTQFARVLREATSNALRHGSGERLSVRCRYRQSRLVIHMLNPCSAPVESDSPQHYGLFSMRQRLASIDGEMQIHHRQAGFHLILCIPLAPPE